MSAELFGHCVYFTLRDSSPQEISRLLEGCQKYLTGHDGLVFFAAGTLADMHREVNDREFHVALHTVFRDKGAHDAYQVDARHKEFISLHRENWARVRVFDSDMPVT